MRVGELLLRPDIRGNSIRTILKQVMSPRQTTVDASETSPVGPIRFGSFRRVTPIHRGFGTSRGSYIDRYYIEKFLVKNSDCIRGRVLELAWNGYTIRFGGGKVTKSDILDVRIGHPGATIIGDLTSADNIPSDTFDCFILTQTLNFIYDVRAAVQTVHRILKPGGCVLVSVPGIAQLSPAELDYCGEFWRFTQLSMRRLLGESFGDENVIVEAHGNVLAALAFLHGLAAEELKTEELDYRDSRYDFVIVAKAEKGKVRLD